MIMSQHAMDRWTERCPNLDPSVEWLTSKPAGRRTRRYLRESCPNHKKYASQSFNGYYYKISQKGVIFVVTPPETVITVLVKDVTDKSKVDKAVSL